MIYLDYNATSPYSPSVEAFIKNEMINSWANPSSEYSEGLALANEIKLMRSEIAEILGCSSKNIVFNSGATESINTVLSIPHLNSLGVKRIISSPLEHPATLDRLKFLEKNGFEIQMIANDQNGMLDLAQLGVLLSSGGKSIVSLLFANNETGVIHPVKKISEVIKKHQHYFHIDAVQALGKLKFKIEEIGADFMSFSGHKIGSFKGIGILFAENIKELTPLLHGGGQERGYRPGTINYPAIRSFYLALKDASKWDLVSLAEMQKYLEEKLHLEFKAQVNCSSVPRIVNTSNFYFEGKNSREILMNLSRDNIFVSTGSACSSGSFEPSHVIKALGRDKNFANGCLRVSTSPNTTKGEIDAFVAKLRIFFGS